MYNKPFASSWINGLVPPAEVKAAEECPNGVAIVETQLSFVNMLVGAITFGIYTPMHIKVQCAARSGMTSEQMNQLTVPSSSSEDEIIETFQKAGNKAVESDMYVFVKFE